MTWVIIDSDGNESEEIDDEDEAEEQRQSMEQLGVEIVELREVDNECESENEPEGDDDIGADIIEMSGGDGGNENGQDDGKLPEPRPEIKGYRGGVVYCRKCDAFSKQEHRCNLCGTDLAGEPIHRGDQL